MFYNSRTRKSSAIRRAVTIRFLSLLVAGVLLIYPMIQSVTYAQGSEEQTITQIAQQVATANPNTSQEEIEQTIEQIATQTSEAGGDVEQAITQIAQQIASNPSGPVSQSITQIAQQIAAGETDNVNQAITQIAQQTAQAGNTAQQNNTGCNSTCIGIR
jgi:Flp pilus assembly protein TadB